MIPITRHQNYVVTAVDAMVAIDSNGNGEFEFEDVLDQMCQSLNYTLASQQDVLKEWLKYNWPECYDLYRWS